MVVLAVVEYVNIALPFSPFLLSVFAVLGALVLARLAARLIEILPG